MVVGLESYHSRIGVMVCDHFIANKGSLIEMNRQWLSRGIRPDGSEISPQLSVMTAYEKAQGRFSNPERDFLTPDLRHTGTFYASIDIVTDGESVEYTSSDPKWDTELSVRTPLQDWYGDVLGLSDMDWEDTVKEALNGELIDKLRLALNI